MLERQHDSLTVTYVEYIALLIIINVIGNVDYGFGSGRLTALDPASVKKLDQTMRRNRSATTAELLSITRFNITERTIKCYRP